LFVSCSQTEFSTARCEAAAVVAQRSEIFRLRLRVALERQHRRGLAYHGLARAALAHEQRSRLDAKAPAIGRLGVKHRHLHVGPAEQCLQLTDRRAVLGGPRGAKLA